MIKLNGSVELAPVLGLTPYIVDLVETGSTLKANNLEVLQILQEINVHLIANPAYYKYHYQQVDDFVRILEQEAIDE
jgi:ATP phosphoribosyltransferase